ncbi:MAG: hypothetical protein R6V01_06440 [Thermoplasmatota archaeon]
MRLPRSLLVLLIIVISSLFFDLDAEAAETGTDVVNIETYIEFRIDFESGDSLELRAEVLSDPYPISVFLLKGEDAYDDWVESETVDIDAIRNGSVSMNRTSSFQVIENFSEKNTTSFKNSVKIGEHDSYFLIIALHRNDDMEVQDLLDRATRVSYEVDWEVNEKELNLTLLIIAIIFFIMGSVLLVLYFISWKRAKHYISNAEDEASERPLSAQGTKERHPVRSQRSPPLR